MTKGLFEKCICIHFWIKSMKTGLIRLINTVLVYKLGSKAKNIFSFLKHMMSQLSNALSIVAPPTSYAIVLRDYKFFLLLRFRFHSRIKIRRGDNCVGSNPMEKLVWGTDNFAHVICHVETLFSAANSCFQLKSHYIKIPQIF